MKKTPARPLGRVGVFPNQAREGGRFMRKKSEKGQAMVEFALILPVLLLIIAGIIDFGLIYNQKVLANNASREAARYVAVNYNENLKLKTLPNNELQLNVENKAKGYLPAYIVNKNPTVDTAILSGGKEVRVIVNWHTSALMPVYSKLASNVPIESTTYFKIE